VDGSPSAYLDTLVAVGESGDSSVERHVTLVVKTFERPNAIRRLVASVRRFYPGMAIVVVDDSAEPLEPVPDGITDYCRLPFNSGAAMGRNVGLRRVKTPYVVFADDDHVFGPETDLQKMFRALRRTSFDLISCTSLEHRPGTTDVWVKRFEGTLDLVDGVLWHRTGATRGYVEGFPVYDVVLDFFMARRDRLGKDPWDPRLKIGPEHPDFFMTLKERAVRCTTLSGVAIHHYAEWTSPTYMAFRTDTDAYVEIWHQKWGIDREIHVDIPSGRRSQAVERYRRTMSYAVSRLASLVNYSFARSKVRSTW
jgi:glycosyltransferase involved in cell wall biosynthesis